MHLKRCLLILATTCIAFTAAMPLARLGDDAALARREPEDFEFDLYSRATPNQKANAVFKAQGVRTAAKETKKVNNAAKFGAIADPKAKGKAIQAAQKDAKAQRAAKWDAKSKKPATPGQPKKPQAGQPPKPPRPGKVAKAQVRAQNKEEAKKELGDAAKRMKNTLNIPGRKDTFKVGDATNSGKEVRKAVMLTHLNEKNPTPYGKQGNGYPKTVKPYNYPNYEKDTKAKGEYVLPQGGLQEHPITKKGWQGGQPGLTRVLTSKENGRDKLDAVVGHKGHSKGHTEAVRTPGS